MRDNESFDLGTVASYSASAHAYTKSDLTIDTGRRWGLNGRFRPIILQKGEGSNQGLSPKDHWLVQKS
jgi:hypothetical protein